MDDRAEGAAIPVHAAATWDRSVADYEAMGEPFTRQYAVQALALAGGAAPGERILDVAAGTGALSLPAARAGAQVLAVDFSPGMVARLGERVREEGLAGRAQARVMDGQALDLPDGGFDKVFSIFGVMMFPDFRKGLAEMVRVLRPRGTACIAVWTRSTGAGPAPLLAEVLRSVVPDLPPPTPPGGMQVLIHAEGMAEELAGAGLAGVEVTRIQGAWRAPSAAWVVDNAALLFHQSPVYGRLDEAQRAQVADVLRAKLAADFPGEVVLPAEALVGIGYKP